MTYIVAVFASPDQASHALYELCEVKGFTAVRSVILQRNDLGTFIHGRSLGLRPQMLPAGLRLEIGQCALIAEIREQYPATSAMIVRSNGGTLSRIDGDSDLPAFFATVPELPRAETPPETLPPAKRLPDNPYAELMPVTTSLNAAPRLYGNPLVVACIVFGAVAVFIVLAVTTTHARH